MSFDEFVAKWTNQPVDFDQIYPNQCMDLMHQYVYDVLGLTDKSILAAPAAALVYTGFPIGGSTFFERIDNTPDGIPQKGDIVFFGTQIGPYGHVCIFVDGDQNTFHSFDANWPTGSLPHIQEHTYAGVLGWLRPRPQVAMTTIPQAELDQLRSDRDHNWQLYQADEQKVQTLTAQIQELQAKIVQLSQTSDQSALTSLRTQVQTIQNALVASQTALGQSRKTLTSIKSTVYGAGFIWTKVQQVKAILAQGGI